MRDIGEGNASGFEGGASEQNTWGGQHSYQILFEILGFG